MSAIASYLLRKADEQVERVGWIVDRYAECEFLDFSVTDSFIRQNPPSRDQMRIEFS